MFEVVNAQDRCKEEQLPPQEFRSWPQSYPRLKDAVFITSTTLALTCKTVETMTIKKRRRGAGSVPGLVCTGGMDLECNLERLPDVFYPTLCISLPKSRLAGSSMPCPSELKSSSQSTHALMHTRCVSAALPNDQPPCRNSTNDVRSQFRTTRPRFEEQQQQPPFSPRTTARRTEQRAKTPASPRSC